nr:hypothetical protein [Candidatus Sigynarchaeota archaeon]
MKDGNIKVDVISLTPSTEIKQQDTDGYLILDYSFDNTLARVSVEGKMNKFNIREIIEKNREAFEHRGIDESDLEQYIVDLLAGQSQVVDSVEMTDDGVNITINSMDFGKNDVMIQKIVEMYDKYSLIDIFDKDNNCGVSFLAKTIPDTNEITLLREYLGYIIKQRFLGSITSCSINQIQQWLEVINQKVKEELIDATDEMAQEISDWLSTNENILIVDEEISEYLNENCPILSQTDARLCIVEQGNLYRAFKIVDEVDFDEIVEAESRWFSGDTIKIQVDDGPEIKFTTTLVPSNEDDFLLLLAKEISSRHAQFTFETIDAVKRHIESIIDTWRVLTSKAGETWDVPVSLSEFTSGTKSFDAFLNNIDSVGKNYKIFSIESQRLKVEMNAHLASLPVQVSLSEPSNENLKEGSFDLYYQISAADALSLSDSDVSLKKVKNTNILTSFLYHSCTITQNISDQGSISVNLHRIIKSEDADKIQMQKAIIHLFYKASSKSIKKLSRQAIIVAFLNYLSEYNEL